MNEEYYFSEDFEKDLRTSSPAGKVRPDNYGLAVVSMVLGIISLVFFLFGLNFISAIVSIILAIIFLASNAGNGIKAGKGMAIAGIVTSGLSIALFIGCIIFVTRNATNIIHMFESEFMTNPDYYEFYEDEFDLDFPEDYDFDVDDTL